MHDTVWLAICNTMKCCCLGTQDWDDLAPRRTHRATKLQVMSCIVALYHMWNPSSRSYLGWTTCVVRLIKIFVHLSWKLKHLISFIFPLPQWLNAVQCSKIIRLVARNRTLVIIFPTTIETTIEMIRQSTPCSQDLHSLYLIVTGFHSSLEDHQHEEHCSSVSSGNPNEPWR